MIDFRVNQPVRRTKQVRPCAVRNIPLDGQVRRPKGKEHEEMHECTGTIKRLLNDGEVTQLKSLFAMVERQGPRGDMLGVIDLTESPDCAACPDRLSWGYSSYCQNPEKLGDIESQADTQSQPEP
ncbi:MAG: hypothetical protein ABIJ00_07860 [Candidatus Eisenbacteria bacterium]